MSNDEYQQQKYWLTGYYINIIKDEDKLWKLYYLDGKFIKMRETTMRKVKKLSLLKCIHKTNDQYLIDALTYKLINLE